MYARNEANAVKMCPWASDAVLPSGSELAPASGSPLDSGSVSGSPSGKGSAMTAMKNKATISDNKYNLVLAILMGLKQKEEIC